MPQEESSHGRQSEPARATFVSRVLQMATRAPGFGAIAAVFGIGVLIITLTRFGVSLLTLALGIFGTLLLAVLYVAFSWVTKLRTPHRSFLAQLLAYCVVFTATAIVFLAFSSTFFDQPIPIKSFIIRKLNPKPTANVASILRDIKVGTTTIRFAEERVLGAPFEIIDGSLRRYKLAGGALEVILFPDAEMPEPKVEAIYLEWVRRPEPPYPIFYPQFLSGNTTSFNFGTATIDDVLSNIEMTCEKLTGDTYQSVNYVGMGCESRLGARDPWYYAFAITHRTQDNRLLSSISSADLGPESIALEPIDIIVVAKSPDPMITLAAGKDIVR